MAVERYYKRSVCSAGDSPCWSIRIHVQTLVQLLSEVVRAWVQCRLLCAVHLRGYRVQRSVGGLLVTAQICGAASCINLRHSSICEEVCFSLSLCSRSLLSHWLCLLLRLSFVRRSLSWYSRFCSLSSLSQILILRIFRSFLSLLLVIV